MRYNTVRCNKKFTPNVISNKIFTPKVISNSTTSYKMWLTKALQEICLNEVKLTLLNTNSAFVSFKLNVHVSHNISHNTVRTCPK